MYRYDEFDSALIEAHLAEFGRQIERRLAGELTEDQFAPLRLRHGVHLQPHSYMLRVAIRDGALHARQLRMLAHVARTYDRGYARFTTRRNVEFQWPALSDIPSILADLATVGLYAIEADETRIHGDPVENVTAQQQPGYASVTIALNNLREVSGDISAHQMNVVADLSEHYGSGKVRIIGEQDLMLPHVELIDLKTVYAGLAEIGLAPANVGPVGDIAAAPGFDSEQIAAVDAAIETHLPIRNDHSERFLDDYRRVGPAPLKEALHGAEARVA